MSGGTLRGPGFGGPSASDPERTVPEAGAPEPIAPSPSSTWAGMPAPTDDDASATVPEGAGRTLETTAPMPMPSMPMASGASGVRGAMFVDAADTQPPSLLAPRRLERTDLLAGLAGVVGFPIAIGLLWASYHVLSFVGLLRLLAWIFGAIVAFLTSLFGTPSNTERAIDRPPPEVENVVAARFVVLGEELDPHELPDRIVPILRTDEPEPTDAPSLRENPEPPPERERHERDPRSVDDLIRRLSDDAQIFAEREEERLREGSPDGIEEGTERTGTEGDIYRGRVMTFFRRGWTVPTTLSEDELSGLRCTVMVEIGLDTRIVGWRISSGSGNPEFDASVEAQLTRLMASEPNIPAPPDDVADEYLGREIAIRFNGRDARR